MAEKPGLTGREGGKPHIPLKPDPKLIKTVRGIGYSFVGDVEITQSSDGATKSA